MYAIILCSSNVVMPFYTYLHNRRVDIHFQSWNLMSTTDKGAELPFQNHIHASNSCLICIVSNTSHDCVHVSTTSIRPLRNHPKSVKEQYKSITALDLQIFQSRRTSFQWCRSITQDSYPCTRETFSLHIVQHSNWLIEQPF